MRHRLTSCLVLLSFLTSGCTQYHSNRKEIDSAYQQQVINLDHDCKDNLTEWCKQKYLYTEQKHDQDVRQDTDLKAANARTNTIATVVTFAVLIVIGGSIAAACAGKQCAR